MIVMPVTLSVTIKILKTMKLVEFDLLNVSVSANINIIESIINSILRITIIFFFEYLIKEDVLKINNKEFFKIIDNIIKCVKDILLIVVKVIVFSVQR